MSSLLQYRITAYLSGGGLFNPELANHDAVRDLLIDCRAALASGDEVEQLRADKRYNHDCLNRIARAVDALGETSETVAGRVEQLRKDANRYRYMRDTGIAMHQLNHLESTLGGDRLDAAIDAAIARSTKA